MFAGQIAETLGLALGVLDDFTRRRCRHHRLLVSTLPREERKAQAHLDWLGFISLSSGIAAAQLVFSRGQRLDWFDSIEIVARQHRRCLMLYFFCVHSLTSDRPFVRLRLLADRNYALGLGLVTLFGMLNFAIIVLLPPLLQQHAGYPGSAIGEIIGWRGLGSAIGFLLAMPMGRLDPRISLSIGALLQMSTGLWLMSFDLNVGMTALLLCNMLQGMSIGVSWVPLTVITFWTLSPKYRAEAMSMFHLLRNFGSSLFISVAVARSSARSRRTMRAWWKPSHPTIASWSYRG